MCAHTQCSKHAGHLRRKISWIEEECQVHCMWSDRVWAVFGYKSSLEHCSAFVENFSWEPSIFDIVMFYVSV